MKTLTENDLKMYLGTGLKGQFNPNEVSSNLQNETRIKELKNTNFDFFLDFCKPILYPLSHLKNLKNEILIHWGGGLTDVAKEKWLNEMIDDMSFTAYNALRYDFIEFMVEHHIDFLNLINQGLAIPVTEEFNPYK